MEKKNVTIKGSYIKIDQLLKFVGMVNSGAEVKYIIQEEVVLHNGCRVSQRGKKVKPGDVVIFRETEINVC
ncbi:MAG: RNA-binding S4 domain-containing protein [Clostridiaceae bacterium]|nr:RNA-binding S4 domain-containing protein [Clostridiaceae bacterium]